MLLSHRLYISDDVQQLCVRVNYRPCHVLQEKVHAAQLAERLKREEAASAAEKLAAAAALMRQVCSN